MSPTRRRSSSRKTDLLLDGLPGLPRMALTPEQQMEAVQKAQSQAEQRVKLATVGQDRPWHTVWSEDEPQPSSRSCGPNVRTRRSAIAGPEADGHPDPAEAATRST